MKVKKETIEKEMKESMKIEIGFPECVHIELVQANDLRHYEIFGGLFSLFLSAACGFWVSFITSGNNKVLFIISIIFTLFSICFALVAGYYRSKISDTKLKKVMLLENFNN